MNWRRVDRYHIRSDDGVYSICRAYCGDIGTYSAFAGRTTKTASPRLVGTTRFETASEKEQVAALKAAKQLCINDARTRT